MTFKELMVKDASLVIFNADEFAEDVLYNGAFIRAIVELEQEQAPGNTFTNEGEADRATIYVLIQNVPNPNRGDTVEVGTVIWEVARVTGTDPAVHTLLCIANERPGW